MGVINLGILVKKIMGKIAGAGYVKDTDYASSSKGGTIKVDTTYATDITSGGKLKAKEITAEAYSEANDGAFISKATLDNVLAAQPAGGMTLEQLYSGSIQQGSTTWKSLSKNYTDYSMILVVMAGTYNASAGEFIPTAIIPTDSTSAVKFGLGGTSSVSIRFDANDAKHFCAPSGSGTLSDMYIYGIK